jgi:hypothetical protein
MFRGKLLVLSFIAAAVLCWQFLPLATSTTSSGIPDPCSLLISFVEPGSRCWFICPQGDGQTLASGNNRIRIIAKDVIGQPIPGILASDFWLVGCEEQLCLCGGAGAIDADSATNDQGITTISGTMASGGCDLIGVFVVVQGIIAGCPPCLSMTVVSPDLDCDEDVDLVDFALFAPTFNSTSPGPPYDPCCDFDCDGDVDLVDFSQFAQHWQHTC